MLAPEALKSAMLFSMLTIGIQSRNTVIFAGNMLLP
jgi:hypothetical protein